MKLNKVSKWFQLLMSCLGRYLAWISCFITKSNIELPLGSRLLLTCKYGTDPYFRETRCPLLFALQPRGYAGIYAVGQTSPAWSYRDWYANTRRQTRSRKDGEIISEVGTRGKQKVKYSKCSWPFRALTGLSRHNWNISIDWKQNNSLLQQVNLDKTEC